MFVHYNIYIKISFSQFFYETLIVQIFKNLSRKKIPFPLNFDVSRLSYSYFFYFKLHVPFYLSSIALVCYQNLCYTVTLSNRTDLVNCSNWFYQQASIKKKKNNNFYVLSHFQVQCRRNQMKKNGKSKNCLSQIIIFGPNYFFC